MGIPNFFSWLCKRYPLIKYDFPENHGHHVDLLFLDMNVVIYQCAMNNNVLFKDQLQQREFDDLWTSIYNYVDNIISLAQPQQVVYMAFDGGAPRAKMNQQRQRRFQSAEKFTAMKGKLDELGVEITNETYKNNQITAGTEFMHKLNQQIKFFIKRKFYEDPKWRKLKVIYSGADVEGEGEHKILKYIRELKQDPQFDPNWSFMVYSPDADLIMLGLSTHLSNFLILREKMPPWERRKITAAAHRKPVKVGYEVINLKIVREYMDLEYKQLEYQKEYDVYRIIDDFVLIAMLVGNDFLPRMFCFDIRQGTLELLLEVFKKYQQSTKDYLTKDGIINWVEMLHLTRLLSEFEVIAMERRVTELSDYLKENQQHPKFLDEELDMLKKLQIDYQNKKNDDARKRFYEEKCGINFETNLQEIKDMTQNYLEGLQFVMQYYYLECPSWKWFYRFYYSPLCSELFLYLQQYSEVMSVKFQKDEGYPLQRKLVCVLPISSAGLLPKPYRFLLEDPNSPLRKPIDYFPKDFDIDPFGAFWDHQFIVKIPFVDQSIIDQLAPELDAQLTDEERQIVANGSDIYFYYDQKSVEHVESLLPSVYQNFEVNLTIGQYENTQQIQLTKSKINLPNVPSLETHNIDFYKLEEMKFKDKRSKVLKFCQRSSDTTQLKQALKKDKFVWGFAGFPVKKYCEVLALITPKEVTFAKSCSLDDVEPLLNVDYAQPDHQDCYSSLEEQVVELLRQMGMKPDNVNDFLVVAYFSSLKLKSNGQREYRGQQTQLIPAEWFSLKQEYNMKYQIKRTQQLQDEFKQGQNVIIFNPSTADGYQWLDGCVCSVQKCIPETQKLIVQSQTLQKINNQIPYIALETYYTVKFVASQLDVQMDALLLVLGSVKLLFDRDSEKFSDGIDLGLNMINMYTHQIVPQLVRLQEADEALYGAEKFNLYRNSLELSYEAVNIVVEYKKRFTQLFKYLELKSSKEIQQLNFFNTSELFQSKKPDQDIYQIYIWILLLPSSSYPLKNCTSSCIADKDLQNLQKQRFEQKEDEVELLINAGFVVGEDIDYYVPPFYTHHPPFPFLGVRVVNLNATTSRRPKFGAGGTIIGILGEKSLQLEILWDEPQIGLTGHRGGFLRSSIVTFEDIFCLGIGWNESLSERHDNIVGWDYNVSQFKPKFKSKAISSNQENKQVMKIKKKVNPFK